MNEFDARVGSIHRRKFNEKLFDTIAFLAIGGCAAAVIWVITQIGDTAIKVLGALG